MIAGYASSRFGRPTSESIRRDTMRSVRWGVLGLAVVAVLALGAQGIRAAETGLAGELKTAITHAGFAAKYDTMQEVMLHLHHVVNCLVGPDDPLFDKAAGDPGQRHCQGVLFVLKRHTGTGPR